MKLNTKAFRYLSPDDWRVLTAVEVGSKNHEIVPTPLIVQLSSLRTGSNAVHKSISTLAKADLIARMKNAKYDGYRLTYGGLDYLALHAHTKSDAIVHLGSQMGVGKESDIYLVTSPVSALDSSAQSDGARASVQQSILKIHRLGRTSFRSLNNNRSYKGRRAHCTWQYLSRLSAQKEYTAMRALYDAGFSVPRPIAWNRHTVVMELVPGLPLRQVPLSAFGPIKGADTANKTSLERIESLYSSIMELALELASVGIIHGDFNEFNILVENVPDLDSEPSSDSPSEPATRKEMKPWLIDFPQVTSLMHPNAEFYFQRDIDCIKDFFRKRYNFVVHEADGAENGPTFQEAQSRLSSSTLDFAKTGQKRTKRRIDVEIEAAGFSRKMAKELSSYYDDNEDENENGEEREGEGEGEGEDEQSEKIKYLSIEQDEIVVEVENQTVIKEEEPQVVVKEEEETRGGGEQSREADDLPDLAAQFNTTHLDSTSLLEFKNETDEVTVSFQQERPLQSQSLAHHNNRAAGRVKTRGRLMSDPKAAAGWAI